MKFALITPPLYGPLLLRSGQGYHFVLAQYLADLAYMKLYRHLKAKGHFIMLDNGAAELGHSIEGEQLVQFANELQPDEVIMPDVLRDSTGTVTRTRQVVHKFPKRQRAVVPQGQTWGEWEECARQLVNFGCATICVPKLYEKYPGGRLKALEIIESNHWHWSHNVHLLGIYQYPVKEICQVNRVYPWVRGIDSAAPIAYAQAGKSITDSKRSSLEWTQLDTGFTLAAVNLDDILAACEGELCT